MKIAAIGDVVMALAMVNAARRTDPSVRIAWMCGRVAAPVLSMIRGIDELIVVDESRLFGGRRFAALTELARLWRRTAGRRFDRVCLAHRDRRYRLLTLALRTRDKRALGSGRADLIPGRHHSDEYVRLLTGIDGPDAPRGELPPLAEDRLPDVDHMLPRTGDRTVVLVPGGARNVLRDDALRRWPLDRYSLLAEKLLASGGTRVVIVGAPSDSFVPPAFEGLEVVDLVARTTLPELVAVFSLADLVVSHDTSAVHLARLAETRILALFGPTSPHEKLFRDGGSRAIWGGEGLACRPCYDGRDFYPCESVPCMHEITVERTLSEIRAILAEPSRSPRPRSRDS